MKVIDLTTSPIEFVITGPMGKRNTVLVSGGKAGLDLVGFSAKNRGKIIADEDNWHYVKKESVQTYLRNSALLTALFPPPKREQMHSVDCVTDPIYDSDARKVIYRLSWKGECSEDALVIVEHMFESQFPDFAVAFRDEDIRGIEWSLAPIILECFELHLHASNRKARRMRLAIITILFYALLFAFVVGIKAISPK